MLKKIKYKFNCDIEKFLYFVWNCFKQFKCQAKSKYTINFNRGLKIKKN